MQPKNQFSSIAEVMSYFSTEKKCLKFLERWRWKGRPVCPHCDHDKVYRYSDKVKFKCAGCRKQFTAKVGTFMDPSKISLQKWFLALYMQGVRKKGVSMYELSRDLKVSVKTAWFMTMRIRNAFRQRNITPMGGAVMCDETFVGGRNKNRHLDKKVEKSQGRVFKDKTPVLGIMEPHGIIKTFVVPDTKAETLQPILKHVVIPGTTLVSDEWNAYKGVGDRFDHKVIDHTKLQYVTDEGYTTNPVEGFWAYLKKPLHGTHGNNLSKKHLQRYVDEYTFKYNHRKLSPEKLYQVMIENCDRKLRYKTLIDGKE